MLYELETVKDKHVQGTEKEKNSIPPSSAGEKLYYATLKCIPVFHLLALPWISIH